MLGGLNMARMYAKRKGKSGSTKPHNESLPEWSNTDAKAVTELVVELGKAGHSSASIGTILRRPTRSTRRKKGPRQENLSSNGRERNRRFLS